MSELTREQVEQLPGRLTEIQFNSMWALALATDAALRARILKLEQDRETWKPYYEQKEEDLRAKLEAVEHELSQRKGWQQCQTHKEINADHHWGCPDCVRELRTELVAMTKERDGWFNRWKETDALKDMHLNILLEQLTDRRRG